MSIPGVHIETLQPPQAYTTAQIDRAVQIADQIGRGRLVLCEPPDHGPDRG